jgi:serine phosphatase RsbU (regulator of sigma subunit)
MAFLERKNGRVERFEISAEKCVLGRHPDCDIVVDAGAVSRHHARVTRQGGRYFVEDLRSRNGTYVNGRMVLGPHLLHSGDEIRVCDVTFTFRLDDESNGNPIDLTVLFDDSSDSTISCMISQLDVSTEDSGVRLSASAEVRLQAILEIIRSLGKSLSLDQVLPQVLNSLFKIFLNADRGFIVLLDERGELIPRWTKLRHESSGGEIRISRTIVHKVIETKQALLSADASNDVRFDPSQSIVDFRIRSLICAPLLDADGDVLGVIQVDSSDQRKRFTQGDLEVLSSVAIQAAVAIDNAQLHESLLRQKKYESELEYAKEVQIKFLPKKRPDIKGYEFFDYYRPANHVGGDYYDYVQLPDGRLAIAVADVVGHGIAAALTMARLSSVVKFSLASNASPANVVRAINDHLVEGEFDGRFITLVLAILDIERHELSYVVAGHSPPLHKRSNGSFTCIDAATIGCPLLIDERTSYVECSLTIEPGDVLALFTDGLSEAANEVGELYGLSRIQGSMTAKTAMAVGNRIIRDLDRFVNGGALIDDMCLVCFSRGK